MEQQDLPAQAHNERLNSLVELDPSPIETPEEEKQLDVEKALVGELGDVKGTDGTRTPPAHALGLSGLGAGNGAHGAAYYCK